MLQLLCGCKFESVPFVSFTNVLMCCCCHVSFDGENMYQFEA